MLVVTMGLFVSVRNLMYQRLVLLKGVACSSEVENQITRLVAQKSALPLSVHSVNESLTVDEQTLFLTCLSDSELKAWLVVYLKAEVKPALAILPNEFCPYAMRSFGVNKDLNLALEDALDDARCIPMDVLLCNDVPVLRHLTVGDVFGLNKTLEPNFWQKVRAFWQNLHQIRFNSYSLITAKEQTIQTAATGLLVMEHNSRALGANRLSEDLSCQDGKLSAFVLAPRSLLSYLTFLFVVFFVRRFRMQDVSKTVGVIKTGTLTITSGGRDMAYRLDGENLTANQLSLQICPLSIRVHLGRGFGDLSGLESKGADSSADKDTVRVQALPQGELTSALLSKPLSFFPRASDDDFKDVFVSLRAGAQFSESYIVLMVLSTLLAATGLFMSSAPVIIGAMILAPLMSPIISLSMGVVRYENNLMFSALKSIFWGSLVALLVAMLFTWMMPLHTLTPEIEARLNPNVLDLMVAVVSGIAGAYASARSEVAKSLAGVAIAVALIPPLSVTGIGLGWGDMDIVIGSFLLFLTNLVGITLAAAITFIVLGYSPLTRAKKGVSYIFVLMALITIPLMVSFYDLLQKNQFMQQMQAVDWAQDAAMRVEVTNVALLEEGAAKVWVDVLASEPITPALLRQVQQRMQQQSGRAIELEVSQRLLLQQDGGAHE
ncbi:MAG: TIGR00341 family protein [Thiomicrospira sp.]|nr:TIGR00341 family protein [Thiomicrospira sp.]